jgi:dTDP-4-amino-4,6-dideoxygalactose transaminase
MINVTEPYLPDISIYNNYISDIFKRNWLTNNGPLVNKLEVNLKKYLNLKHLLFVSNGTIALQLAIKALNLRGEIITTPFTYVATTSSIVWEGCTPVFVDIEKDSFNIDPNKIEKAITKNTTAIIATHVFGNPCSIIAIQDIAERFDLKVIYDGAHAFGIKYNNKSIFSFGNISTCSFHATKIYHTVEGGAVITNDDEINNKLSYLRNFGHHGPEKFVGIGINAKNSEFHAAMGLSILPDINLIIEKRKLLSEVYNNLLSGTNLKFQKFSKDSSRNYSYFPVLFDSEKELLRIKEKLKRSNVNTRRYFYPLLSRLNYVDFRLTPVAQSISERILCLPLSYRLSINNVHSICKIIVDSL